MRIRGNGITKFLESQIGAPDEIMILGASQSSRSSWGFAAFRDSKKFCWVDSDGVARCWQPLPRKIRIRLTTRHGKVFIENILGSLFPTTTASSGQAAQIYSRRGASA